MFIDKYKVLADASLALNKPDQPWEASIEEDRIVARWKWMDAAFFSPTSVSAQTKSYQFIITLKDNGKYKELDKTASSSASASAGGIKLEASGFVGKTTQKSFEFGVGKNRQTGESGAIGFHLDTAMVKRSIRNYLTACGWKKSGLFGL